MTGQKQTSKTSQELAGAMALHRSGRFAEADTAYRAILADDPKNADVLHLLGLIAYQLGNFGPAAEFIDSALRLRPTEAKFHSNRGNVAKADGDIEGAQRSYERALDCDPGFADARFNLGILLQESGDLPAAARTYRALLDTTPDYVDAINNLGMVNLNLGRLPEAAALFERLIKSGSATPETWLNLGSVRERQKQTENAISALEKALALKPDYAEAKSMLRYHYLRICAWEMLARISETIDEMAPRSDGDDRVAETPFTSLVSSEDPALNLRVARSWATYLKKRNPPLFDHANCPAVVDGPLTIAYLSGDMRDHPVAHLTRGLFLAHDRNRFRINLYSYGSDDDSDYRREIAAGCDSFVDIRKLSLAVAARRIHADGADILVDLNGWTQGNRLSICAHRPAPVQAIYLGYPGTSGAEFFDYAVVDRTVAPESEAAFFTESLAYMPHCYLVNDDSQQIAVEPVSRSDCGLPENGTVFCCFNASWKIEPVMFALWMEVLRAVPGSVLWLSSGNDRVSSNLRASASRLGIDPSRLIFAERWQSKSRHLRRIQLADLALDTRIYNGHTTTCDMLWAGVPVVAIEGSHFASRVSASCLRAVGRPELIATSPEAFKELAVGLARDPAALADLKTRLWGNRTREPLFDTTRFARALEDLFRAMWERHMRGLPPSKLEIPQGPSTAKTFD